MGTKKVRVEIKRNVASVRRGGGNQFQTNLRPQVSLKFFCARSTARNALWFRLEDNPLAFCESEQQQRSLGDSATVFLSLAVRSVRCYWCCREGETEKPKSNGVA